MAAYPRLMNVGIFPESVLTLNQPQTHKASIGIYMGVVILGIKTLYTVSCLVYKIPMEWKGLVVIFMVRLQGKYIS